MARGVGRGERARSRFPLRAVILVVVTVLVYVPAIRGGFVYDDFDLVLENATIASPKGLSRIWMSTAQPDYFPLTWTSFWFEWRLWGTSAAGYHLSNVLLYLVGVVLLWAALLRLRVAGAWLASLLFAVHPVAVASVAWISERKNTLSFVFFALTFLLFLKAEDAREGSPSRTRGWYALSLTAFVLGLLSKTSGVTLPLVLLGCIWWRTGRLRGADLLRVLPFFLVSFALGLVTVWFQFHRAMHAKPLGLGVLERVAHAGQGVWLYLFKALVPVHLSCAYDPWSKDLRIWSFLPALGVVAILAGAWRLRASIGRPILFGFGAYLALLLPVLGLMDMALLRHTPIADHWQFLALPAILALVAAAAVRLVAALPSGAKVPARLAGGLLLAAMAVGCWRRSRLYGEEELLWRDAVAKAPHSAYAHSNLGNDLLQRGKAEESKPFLFRAIKLDRREVLALYNVARISLDEGNHSLAIEMLQAALDVEPRYADARHLIVSVLLHGNRPADAEVHARQALLHSAASAFVLGKVLSRQNSAHDGVAFLEKFLTADTEAAARTALGSALMDRGDLDRAEREMKEAERLAPPTLEAHLVLAFIAEKRHDQLRAAERYRKALELRPDLPEAIQGLERLGQRY